MKPIEQLTDDELLLLLREASGLPDAPSSLIGRSISLMPAVHSPLAQTARSAMRRVVAALTFDSWSGGTLAHGVRGVPVEVRHLLYSTLGRDIDVRVSPAADRFVLAGQVLGPDETGTIELLRAGADADPHANPDTDADESVMAAPVQVVDLDSMGQFRIEGIEHGAWTLRLRLGVDEIMLPPIALGEQRT